MLLGFTSGGLIGYFVGERAALSVPTTATSVEVIPTSDLREPMTPATAEKALADTAGGSVSKVQAAVASGEAQLAEAEALPRPHGDQ